ncbi:hypothetical protein HMPREF1275_01369 [Propionibacterium sp. KPL1844]|nr:hypothetical protein HMPREF1275_01369 [Propionibacterium sp. KPL1844]
MTVGAAQFAKLSALLLKFYVVARVGETNR